LLGDYLPSWLVQRGWNVNWARKETMGRIAANHDADGSGGFVAGMVSIVAAELTGRVLDRDPSFYLPVFIAAGLLYPIGLVVFHLLSPRMKVAFTASVVNERFLRS
jgi:hypothetical protein